MIEAGEWPEPELLERIVATGDTAVEPLHDVLRTLPREGPMRHSLNHAIGLLCDLCRPETVPELVKIVENYHDDTGTDAINNLIDFGTPGFDALLDLCANRALKAFQRAVALDTAVDAAGNDLARRTKLGGTARALLDEAIASAKEERKPQGRVHDEDVIGQFTIDNVAVVVTASAAIADPLARETINSAFDKGLVDLSIVTRRFVDDHYDKPRKRPERELNDTWLDIYRMNYEIHVESLEPEEPTTKTRPKYRYQDRYDEGDPPADTPATAPIRNSGPRTGATTIAGAAAARSTRSATWERKRAASVLKRPLTGPITNARAHPCF